MLCDPNWTRIMLLPKKPTPESPSGVWCSTRWPNSCATLKRRRSPAAVAATTMTGVAPSPPAQAEQASRWGNGTGMARTQTPWRSNVRMSGPMGGSGGRPRAWRVTAAAATGSLSSRGKRRQ
jgi:hypothetical protein